MPRRVLARLLAVGVALVLSLAAVELGFRLVGVGGPYDTRDLVFAWRPAPPFAPSATTGVRLMPGFRGEMVYLAAGGVVRAVPVRTNAAGLRGPEVPTSVGVLAVGDSMTFGQGVTEDEAWPAVLGRRIGRTTVNAGQPSWNLAQEAAWVEATAGSLRPAGIVVAWFANDLDAPGQYVPADKPHPLVVPAWARAARGSPSWALAWGMRTWERRATAAAVLGEWADYREALTHRDGDAGVRSRQRASFATIRAACVRLAVPCLVVTLPLLPVAEDPAVAALAAHAREDAAAAGLAAVDLTPVVASVPLERRIVYPSDPHPSAAMHEAIAAAVAGEIAGW